MSSTRTPGVGPGDLGPYRPEPTTATMAGDKSGHGAGRIGGRVVEIAGHGDHTAPGPAPLHGVGARLREVHGASRWLDSLVSSVVSITEGLDLDATLRRVVTTAAELIDARYAALGVLDASGTALESFFHTGLDPPTAAGLGDLPTGGGLLGELIRHPTPLRLDRIADHPASIGFPPGHPPMTGFLGVPIRVRGTVFGNLYLTDKIGGGFSTDDEVVTTALAAAAAVAIENARLHAETRRLVAEAEQRQRWLEAAGEITSGLLAGIDPGEALVVVAERAVELTGADGALIVTAPAVDAPDENSDAATPADPVRVTVAVGLEEHVGVGARIAMDGAGGAPGDDRGGVSPVAAAVRAGAPRVESTLCLSIDGDVVELGPALVVPLHGPSATTGVLLVVQRAGGSAFGTDELAVVASFADQAALVLRQAESLHARQQLELVADRERIAADLHDHVLQRLFALGLGLQATQARVRDIDVAGRVNEAVDQIDTIIRDIRSSIFDLHTAGGSPGLGGRLRRALAETARQVGLDPAVRLSGAVDAVPEGLAVQVEAVVREGVSNAVRHGAPNSIVVTVSADDVLAVEVADDGVGIPDTVARSGLLNLVARARAAGGDATVERRGPDGGTRLSWWAPLHHPEPPPAPTAASHDRSS